MKKMKHNLHCGIPGFNSHWDKEITHVHTYHVEEKYTFDVDGKSINVYCTFTRERLDWMYEVITSDKGLVKRTEKSEEVIKSVNFLMGQHYVDYFEKPLSRNMI